LIRLDTKSIQERIGANPWVADVTVKKQFPGSIRIEIKERMAVAIVDAGGTDLWLVSSDGRWLEPMSARDEGLLVIRDIEGVTPVEGGEVRAPELRNALRIVAGISPALKKLTRAVSAPTIDKTALLTVDDVEVFIGSADQLAEKDRIVREILSSKKNEVVYINVRVVESPIWRGLE
jgi:cell division protein FtsQ